MKVVYPICCGVDVHKTFLVGTIISTTDGVQPHYQKKRFSTYNSYLHRFADWLHLNNCLDVCMESTGKYWVPVYYLISEDSFNPEYCVSLLQRSLKKKSDSVLESIEGYSITDEQKLRMRIVRSHIDYITDAIAQVDSAIDTMVAEFENTISLLRTIPGVDRNSAITVISEIGNDMSRFGSAKRLCCWAGLTPGNNESAGKKKSVRITRAGVYLKPALVQVAHAAVKATDNSYYRLKYEHISKRRGKKRAIIAIVRMILSAIFQMMTTGEVWNPTDLFKVDMPDSLKERQLSKAVKQATKFLEKQGLTVS